jgi:8-hydroxy-5-deazaflavin:NADPH oxidoreductase
MVADLGPGASAGTVAAAAGCPMVALAVPSASVPEAVGGLVWADQIVIDATNAVLFPDLRPAPLRRPYIERDRRRARSGGRGS